VQGRGREYLGLREVCTSRSREWAEDARGPLGRRLGGARCPTLDPQLLMAARRGDINQLKDLLLLKDDDEQQGSSSVAGGAQDVIVEVDPRPPPLDAVAPPSGSSSPHVQVVLDEDGVTMEGDSLLHVVAACGDTQEYLDCAKMIVRYKKHKGGAAAVRLALEARNNKGDTPLHCWQRPHDLPSGCSGDRRRDGGEGVPETGE